MGVHSGEELSNKGRRAGVQPDAQSGGTKSRVRKGKLSLETYFGLVPAPHGESIFIFLVKIGFQAIP